MRTVGGSLGAWLLGVVLAGCGLPDTVAQQEFAERGAAILCDRTRECVRGAFDAQYFGTDDCRAHLETALQDVVADLDEAGCEYDAQQASTALADTRDMTCERFYEGEYAESITAIWGECGVFLPL